MNKKLLGLSALLALVLAGCGGPETSGDTSVPSDTSDTGDTGSTEDTGDTGTSTSEGPTAPSLEEVFGKFIALGNVHNGELELDGHTYDYVRNADYMYLETAGGVARITPQEAPAEEEDGGEDEGARLAQPAALRSMDTESTHTSFEKSDFKLSLDTNALMNNVMKEADETDTGANDIQEEDPPVAPVATEGKYFMVSETVEGYEAAWGAVYENEEEFNKFSVSALFNDFVEVSEGDYEELAKYFINYAGDMTYTVKSTNFVKYFYSYLGLSKFKSVIGDGFVEVGFDEAENPFIYFYGLLDVAPRSILRFNSVEEKRIEGLDTYLATFEDYPHSPVAFDDLLKTFDSNSFASVTDPSDLLDSGYDMQYAATEEAATLAFTGEYWDDYYGFQFGCANIGAGKEVPEGLVTYGVTKDKEIDNTFITDPGEEDYIEYEDEEGYENAKWYETYLCPQVLKSYEAVTEAVNEASGAFHIEGEEPLYYAQRAFRGIYLSCNMFAWTLTTTGQTAKLNVSDMYISYTLEEGKVTEILVEADCDMIVEDTGEVVYEGYGAAFEYFTYFDEIDSAGKITDYLNALEDLTIIDEYETEIVIEPEETHKWDAGFRPEDAIVSYKTSNAKVATIANGVITGVAAGKTKVACYIGDVTRLADVTVKGVATAKSKVTVATGADATNKATLYGVEGGELSAKAADEAVATVTIDGNNVVVHGVNAGKTTVEVTYKLSDAKSYKATFDVTVN